MDCETGKRMISRLVDDELGEKERELVERHVAACPACTAFREDLFKMRALFAADPIPSPSTDLDERVRAAARLELAARRRGVLSVVLRRMAVAAMALAAATIGLFVLNMEPIQAVDTGKEIHYEDLFQRALPGDREAVLEILLNTDNPREALRCFMAERRPE